jgi:hypothetical protein
MAAGSVPIVLAAWHVPTIVPPINFVPYGSSAAG